MNSDCQNLSRRKHRLKHLLQGLLAFALLMVALGLPAYPNSGRVTLTTGTTFANLAHHHQRDEAPRQPACMMARCECHTCPHAFLLAASTAPGPLPRNSGKRWLDDAFTDGTLEVEVPPPRHLNVEYI